METLKYFLEFTFQSFWHFIGIFILISAVFNGAFAIFRKPIIINRNTKEDKKEK